MTTPMPGSGLLGTQSLQTALDQLTAAVSKNTAAVQGSGSVRPGGTTSTPIGNTGQTFTSGSFPKMQSAAMAFSGMGATTGGPGGGGAMNNPAGTLASAGSSFGNQASNYVNGGGSAFSNRILMNQFAAMSTLGMAPGTNLGTGMSAMYRQAFGYYGNVAGMGALASGPADAAQMYSTLQSMAGSPYASSTALGRAGMSYTAGIGYASMGQLSGAQASQAGAQLANPMTSMLMRQMGYGVTPRGMGGNAPTQMGQLVQGMFQRWYGKGSVNQANLNAGLQLGGKLNLNLQALGLDPSTMGPALQMYNKLFQQGVGANQANAMLSAAAGNKNYGGESAQKLLSNKYGIATSDLQKLKDTTAVQTSTTAGEMGGFDSAVSQATTSLQKFDRVLADILKVTGLGSVEGSMAGMSGVMHGVGGVAGKLFGAGVGMLSRLGGSAPGASIGTGMGTPGSANTSSVSQAARVAVKDAEAQVGKPYVWGGDSPQTSFDCSGLVEWAYGQAGIRLPRTSQEQWAALGNRSVPLSHVMEGDIVFGAGSDGTPDAPGHEALMISSKQIVEAPSTGSNIRIRAFDPGEWSHAARPTGNLKAIGGGGATSLGTSTNGQGSASSSTGQGNSGLGLSSGGGLGLATGSYGSSEDGNNVASALLGGITGGSGGSGVTTWTGQAGQSAFGNSSAGNGQGSASGKIKAPKNASASQAQAIAKKLAAAYGWASGAQWDDLVQLWQDESSWLWNAQNPSSPAYGIPQADPGNKMASAGSDWQTNAATQIKWGLGYIKQRYGDPAHALASENSIHSYATGTDRAHPGVALVGERGPELVHLTGGQEITSAGRTADILRGQSARAGQGPWSSGAGAQLMLANAPQNQGNQRYAGKCEVSLNMPQGAIVIHTNGTATDTSNAIRQIMEGVSQAMEDNETLKKIMAGVTS